MEQSEADEIGAKMAVAIRGILDDLDLTPEQVARAPEICRRRLKEANEELNREA